MTNRQYRRIASRADKDGTKAVNNSVITADGDAYNTAYTRGYTESVYKTGKRNGILTGVVGVAVGTLICANFDRISTAAKEGVRAIKKSLKGDTHKSTEDEDIEVYFDEDKEDDVVIEGSTLM